MSDKARGLTRFQKLLLVLFIVAAVVILLAFGDGTPTHPPWQSVFRPFGPAAPRTP